MKQLKDLIEDRLMISIRQFAKETGISRHTIAHILNGEGKKVKVTLFDDTTITGILTRAEWKPDRYEVANYSFRKTHVKKIEVVR